MKGFRQRILALTVLLAMLVSVMPYAVQADVPAFGDIGGHWAGEAVTRWAARDVVRGFGGLMLPDDPLSRAEAAAILNRVFGYQKQADAQFTDVPADAWYREDMMKLFAAGVLEGDGDGGMRPEAHITREESAALLLRAFELEEQPAAPEAFTDGGEISPWAADCVNTMAAAGYLHGYRNEDGSARFEARAEITRAEFLTILDHLVAAFYAEPTAYEDETVQGNAILRADGARLKNAQIEGALYLAEGLGEGAAYLEDIEAESLIVRGGGVDSIYIEGRFAFERVQVTESAVPVALKFPLEAYTTVQEYFDGEAGVTITKTTEYCVVTFAAACSKNGSFARSKTSGPPLPGIGPRPGGTGGGGGSSSDRRQDSDIGDPVTSRLADPDGWLGMEPVKHYMQPEYTRSGRTIKAGGKLAVVHEITAQEGLLGSGSGDCYLAAVSMPLPRAAAEAIQTADGTVLTLKGGGVSQTLSPAEAAALCKEKDGAAYLEFLLFIAQAKDGSPLSYDLTLDFDGSGNNANKAGVYRATEYRLDFQGVSLLGGDQPFAPQTVALKSGDGHSEAYTAAGVTLTDGTYTLDAAVLEKTGPGAELLNPMRDSGGLTASLVFEKPDAISGTPTSVELTVDGAADPEPDRTSALSGNSFEKRFTLCGPDGGYLPNETFDVKIDWKDESGWLLGISHIVIERQTLFTVEFSTQRDIEVPPEKAVSGGTVEMPVVEPLETEMVLGWYLDPEYQRAYDFTAPVTSNLTLYAKWGIPQALRELIACFEGDYDVNVIEMSVTPKGNITIPGDLTIPEGTTLRITKALKLVTVKSKNPLAQVNGTLYRANKKEVLLPSLALTRFQMKFGEKGSLYQVRSSAQEPVLAAGPKYRAQPSDEPALAAFSEDEALIQPGEVEGNPAQIIVSDDALIQFDLTRIQFIQGTFYINDTFYYIHADDSIQIGEDATVVMWKDVKLDGKIYLSGKLVSNGWHVLPNNLEKNARFFVEKAGVDLSALTLSENVLPVENGVSTWEIELKWNQEENAWADVQERSPIIIEDPPAQHFLTTNGEERKVFRYEYRCTGLDQTDRESVHVLFYKDEEMKEPIDLEFTYGLDVWTLQGSYELSVEIYQENVGKTYYVRIEQNGVRSNLVKLVAGPPPDPME